MRLCILYATIGCIPVAGRFIRGHPADYCIGLVAAVAPICGPTATAIIGRGIIPNLVGRRQIVKRRHTGHDLGRAWMSLRRLLDLLVERTRTIWVPLHPRKVTAAT